MPPIIENPRYERLAQYLAAGMRQADICRELDFTEPYVSELKNTEIIRTRLKELLEQHAQKSIDTSATVTLEERKTYLSKIVRTEPEGPVSAGHVIAASHQLNLIEKVYELGGQNKLEIKMVTLVLNNEAKPAPMLHNGYSAKEIEEEGKQ